MYELTGRVRRIGELQKFASGFTKRELVVDEDHGGSWPKTVAFAFKRDNIAMLEGVGVGAKVRIAFAIDGREWTDPKTNQVKCFCDLTAIRLETLEPAEAPMTPAEAKGTIHEPEDGDIPF